MTDFEERTVYYCGRCGAPHDGSGRFCSQCGNPLESSGNPNGHGYNPRDGAGQRAKRSFDSWFGDVLDFLEQRDYVPSESEEQAFIGTNTGYYADKFREMRTLNQKVSLNWAALFFGIFWMLYRKMYGVAAASIAATVIAGLFGAAAGPIGLVLTVCYGLFGNYLYMMTIQKRVTDGRQYAEPAYSRFVEKYAGVSGNAVLIGLVVIAVGSIPFWLVMGMSFLGMLGALL